MQEMLKQPQYQPLSLDKMVASLWAVGNGYVDKAPVDSVGQWELDAHAYLMPIIRRSASRFCAPKT